MSLHLPNVTLLIIDCVNINRAILSMNISSKDIVFGKKVLITSNDCLDSLEQKTDIDIITLDNPLKSIKDYSKFMIKELCYYVETEFVLVTQWDAFVLNHEMWTNEFFNYDYIGAPWWWDENNIGNGAFSLRSKKFRDVCSTLPIKNYHPEDLVLCRTYKNYLESKDIKFAPEELATKFSFEGNAKYGYQWNGKTFGFHDFEMSKINNWIGYKDFKKEESKV